MAAVVLVAVAALHHDQFLTRVVVIVTRAGTNVASPRWHTVSRPRCDNGRSDQHPALAGPVVSAIQSVAMGALDYDLSICVIEVVIVTG